MPSYIRPSAVPTPIHTRCTFLLKSSASAMTPLWAVFTSTGAPPKPPPAPLKPPMYENRSRWSSVIWNVCPPPMDSPAIARCSRSGMVR